MPERLLTLSQVEDQTGFRKSKIYELIAAKEFPEPIHFGLAVRWLESEVQLWIKIQVRTHRNSIS
ncbi:MAG: helix-turn-helix transcriptional regulator [bacterium]